MATNNKDQKPLGLGLIGCGAFGLFCLDSYSRMDSIHPVAVADMREQVVNDFGKKFGLKAFVSPAEMIALVAECAHHAVFLIAARPEFRVRRYNFPLAKPVSVKVEKMHAVLYENSTGKALVPEPVVCVEAAVSCAVCQSSAKYLPHNP